MNCSVSSSTIFFFFFDPDVSLEVTSFRVSAFTESPILLDSSNLLPRVSRRRPAALASFWRFCKKNEVIVRGGGIEKMLDEPPSVAIKREKLQRSIGLLKASKEVIEQVMDGHS
ncbi:dynamin related protein 4C [Artemisia annua]|uniref:Dynamin related protein 4C n=1 Tax=Artemisia annua TaxID=35608 RepID=A0A2U1LL49_ARTAN|nr:dynamin related protein 4C [Artemisia annua]